MYGIGIVGARVGCWCLILNTEVYLQGAIHNIVWQLGSKQRTACWDQLSSKTASKPCKLCCETRGGTVWLPVTAKPIEGCFIHLPWGTVYCQGKVPVFSVISHNKREGNVLRCRVVTWDTCSALINLLLWSCVCNSKEILSLSWWPVPLADSLCIRVLLYPDGSVFH